MTIYEDWISPEKIPMQFQGKTNIDAIIRAFSKQLQEVAEIFDQLKEATNLDDAIGINLDNIGEIAVLSRSEAYVVLGTKSKVIDDEVYRKVLQYKVLKNTCDGTYYDLMNSIMMLFNTKTIYYKEDPNYPATAFISIDELNLDDTDPGLGTTLAIKPSGVRVIYKTKYLLVISIHNDERLILEKVDFSFSFLWLKELINGYIFDGSWLLNGIVQLTNNTDLMPTGIEYITKLKSTDEVFLDFELETRSTDFWCLDGSVILDGSKKLVTDRKENL